MGVQFASDRFPRRGCLGPTIPMATFGHEHHPGLTFGSPTQPIVSVAALEVTGFCLSLHGGACRQDGRYCPRRHIRTRPVGSAPA
jgi:hypothetical protein